MLNAKQSDESQWFAVSYSYVGRLAIGDGVVDDHFETAGPVSGYGFQDAINNLSIQLRSPIVVNSYSGPFTGEGINEMYRREAEEAEADED